MIGAAGAALALVAATACGSSGASSTRADGGSSGDASAATAIEDTTPTTPPGPPMTSCTSVVHIGDSTSIGLTSKSYLPDPSQRIDAQYKRVGVQNFQADISGARSIVEHLKNQLNARDAAAKIKDAGYHGCWVFALGTTDSANIAAGSTYTMPDRIDRMMAVVDGDPVLWVNVKTIETKGNWANANMAPFDQALIDAEARYPNLHVYDWAAVVQDGWYSSDKIHYSTPGYAQRAKLIADALATEIPAGGDSSGGSSGDQGGGG